jgi:predicted metal-dependent hydrolase
VQFEFLFDRQRLTRPADVSHPEAVQRNEEWLRVGLRHVRLQFVRHPRARRYVLRLCSDGTARVTIPRRGSHAEGQRFANRNIQWLEKQLLRQANRPVVAKEWTAGTEILFRGEKTRLEVNETPKSSQVCFGDQVVRIHQLAANLRPAIEKYLRQLAARELPARIAELAKEHQFEVRRVSVRNQRSRWGSCSRHGTISLNWRLVQTPVFVRDYIILHELAHLKEMNHSKRFWNEVARLCPEFATAERWLKEHAGSFNA